MTQSHIAGTRRISSANIRFFAPLATALMLSATPALAQVTPVEIPQGDSALFGSRVLTTGLSNPWAMRWGPDNMIWVTERTSGEVTRVDPTTGAQQLLLTIEDVYTGPQHEGLLGLALHPELLQGTGNDFVYLSYTVNNGTAEEPDPSAQIVRYRWDDTVQQLVEPEVVLGGLPAWNDHNAGRVVIGPDMKLYYSIGEQGANFGRNLRRPNLALALPTEEEVEAGNWRTYSGKILRMELDGSIPEDNPEIEGVRSHILSYGHRNPQGLAFGPDGTLYEAEHGPASDDELNIIQPGGNYGWPRVAGFKDDLAYLYINWSEAPEGVDTNTDPLPDTVPTFPETEFEADMVDPLATYFTVEDDYPIGEICGYICDPTVAPSSLLYYEAGETGISEWDNALLIPTLPSNVDLFSTRKFISMMTDVLEQLSSLPRERTYKFLRVVISRGSDTKTSHGEMSHFMEETWGRRMMRTQLKDSAEIDNAGMLLKSVYEIGQPTASRQTWTRCMSYLDAYGKELELLIRKTWPSHYESLEQAGLL